MRATMIALVIVTSVAACGGSAPLNVSQPTAMPSGIVGRPFGPSALGVNMTVPSTWRDAAPAAGFEYRLVDTNPSTFYLLASTQIVHGLGIGSFASRRVSFLKGIGAKSESKRTAVVDSHGAAVLRYRLPVPGQAGVFVDVSEYDIAHGPSVAIVALGSLAMRSDSGLFQWIASTIRVTAE